MMPNNSDIPRRRRSKMRKIRKYRIHTYIIIGLLVFVIALLWPFLYWTTNLTLQIADLNKQKADAIKHNEQLTEETRRLQSNDYIEQYARQQLGLVKPGEIPITEIESTK